MATPTAIPRARYEIVHRFPGKFTTKYTAEDLEQLARVLHSMDRPETPVPDAAPIALSREIVHVVETHRALTDEEEAELGRLLKGLEGR